MSGSSFSVKCCGDVNNIDNYLKNVASAVKSRLIDTITVKNRIKVSVCFGARYNATDKDSKCPCYSFNHRIHRKRVHSIDDVDEFYNISIVGGIERALEEFMMEIPNVYLHSIDDMSVWIDDDPETQVIVKNMRYATRASFRVKCIANVDDVDSFFNCASDIFKSRLVDVIRVRACVRVKVSFSAIFRQGEYENGQFEGYFMHDTTPTWFHSINDFDEFYSSKVVGDIGRAMADYQQRYSNICLSEIGDLRVYIKDLDDYLD